jgi:hypothetical protein
LEAFNASTQALAGVTDDPATVVQAMAWIDALNPIYAFEIGLQGTGLKVSFSDGEAAMIQPEVPLRGEYTCNALLNSCTFDKVNEGRILLDDTGLIGMDLLAEIRVPLIFPPDQNQALLPTQGSLEVQWPADASLAQRNRTVLSFTACDPTVPHIIRVDAQYFEPSELQYADRLCLSFEEFDDLDLAGEVPDWVAYARFGIGAMDVLLEQAELVWQLSLLIDDDLKPGGLGIFAEYCSSFAEAGLIAPPALADRGFLEVQWIDDSADGQVGTGDSFDFIFHQCWLNEAGEDFTDLLDGRLEGVSFQGAGEGAFPLEVGFMGQAQAKPGGVYHRNLLVSEVEQVLGTAEVSETITLGGLTTYNGLSILFSRTDDD